MWAILQPFSVTGPSFDGIPRTSYLRCDNTPFESEVARDFDVAANTFHGVVEDMHHSSYSEDFKSSFFK